MKVKLTTKCHHCGHEYANLEESNMHKKLTCLSCRKFIKFAKISDYIIEEEYVYLTQTTSGRLIGISREKPIKVLPDVEYYKVLLEDTYE